MKPVLGVDTEWQEYCFTRCIFGDILGGRVSTGYIEDSSLRFMNKTAQEALLQNIYMDDICLLQYNDTDGSCDDLIKEVDRGLSRGKLPVKGWVQHLINLPQLSSCHTFIILRLIAS